MTASVAYKKAHKDVEAELCEDARKILKDQKTFNEKYQFNLHFDIYFSLLLLLLQIKFNLIDFRSISIHTGTQHHVHKHFMAYPYTKPLNVYSLRAI